MPSPIRKTVSNSNRVTVALCAAFALALFVTATVLISQSRAPQVTKINYSELYQIAET